MTITLRVQYKSEGARKLKDQQYHEQDPPVYEQDVLRILSMFGIPKPDYMRPIYESGFVFCNYNITRQSKKYEDLEVGARKAHSEPYRKALDGLFVSFMNLAENGKPIFLHPSTRNYSPHRDSNEPAQAPHTTRRRSSSPSTHTNRDENRGKRPLFGHLTWTAPGFKATVAPVAKTASAVASFSTSTSSSTSTLVAETTSSFPNSQPSSQTSSNNTTVTSKAPEVVKVEASLQFLSSSASFKALLDNAPTPSPLEISIKGQASSVKREHTSVKLEESPMPSGRPDVLSPTRLQDRIAPTGYFAERQNGYVPRDRRSPGLNASHGGYNSTGRQFIPRATSGDKTTLLDRISRPYERHVSPSTSNNINPVYRDRDANTNGENEPRHFNEYKPHTYTPYKKYRTYDDASNVSRRQDYDHLRERGRDPTARDPNSTFRTSTRFSRFARSASPLSKQLSEVSLRPSDSSYAGRTYELAAKRPHSPERDSASRRSTSPRPSKRRIFSQPDPVQTAPKPYIKQEDPQSPSLRRASMSTMTTEPERMQFRTRDSTAAATKQIPTGPRAELDKERSQSKPLGVAPSFTAVNGQSTSASSVLVAPVAMQKTASLSSIASSSSPVSSAPVVTPPPPVAASYAPPSSPSTQSTPTVVAPSPPMVIAQPFHVVKAAAEVTSGIVSSRQTRAEDLTRELIDARRQMAVLKTRIVTIVDELKQLGAPITGHAPDDVKPLTMSTAERLKFQEMEMKLKASEAEKAVLRERLEQETTLRKLTEESCETERRRRKYAEGMLDDARREYSKPLVVPAMMDAFEKIAQMTGDALMAVDED